MELFEYETEEFGAIFLVSVQKFQIKKDGSLNTFFLVSSSVIVVPTGNLRNFTAHRRRQRFKKERVLELMATVGFQGFFFFITVSNSLHQIVVFRCHLCGSGSFPQRFVTMSHPAMQGKL